MEKHYCDVTMSAFCFHSQESIYIELTITTLINCDLKLVHRLQFTVCTFPSTISSSLYAVSKHFVFDRQLTLKGAFVKFLA